MRIALLSNVTVEVLAQMLADRHKLWLPSGYGAWMQTALAVPDELKAFDPEAVFLLLDSSHARFDAADAETAVAALEAALPRTTVFVPDLMDLADGAGNFFDERMWQVASMPWSLRGLGAIRDEIERLLVFLCGAPRKKVLALDFDNTLWRGTIGEDGVRGIEPFVDFQRALKSLAARGVLLAGLSKNNAVDVEPVWDDPRMVLTRDDFAALRIDWNDKCENLTAVARELNLGTDAFVFVDDDPAERAQMAAHHPEVAVPEGPVTARRLARLYFPRLRVTDEDRNRTALYRAEAERREAAAGVSVEDYLARLEIRTEIHPMAASEIPRVAQLSQKTNQFNVLTNRYTADDLARFAADPARLLVTAHVRDRFGDLGLVAFVHVVDGEIVDWVMSCRAMNRRVEFAVQAWVERELVRRGVTELRARWCASGRNEPVRELFDRLDFRLVGATDGERRYAKSLALRVPTDS